MGAGEVRLFVSRKARKGRVLDEEDFRDEWEFGFGEGARDGGTSKRTTGIVGCCVNGGGWRGERGRGAGWSRDS